MPSLALLEQITLRYEVSATNSGLIHDMPSMSISEAVEDGCLHISRGGDFTNKLIVDLLPFQMAQAVLDAPLADDLSAVAKWDVNWNTACLTKRPTPFEHLCLLFRSYLDPRGTNSSFKASDGAELFAAWAVLCSIQKGQPDVVLGDGVNGGCTDVVLESFHIRKDLEDDASRVAQNKSFVDRVQELREQPVGHWTVLLPPQNWSHSDCYVVSPEGSVTAVSVKSYAKNVTKQLQKVAEHAEVAKGSKGTWGLRTDRFVLLLGYDDCEAQVDSKIDFVITPSTLQIFFPLSVMHLSFLSPQIMDDDEPGE
jgi:hypothetical protein